MNTYKYLVLQISLLTVFQFFLSGSSYSQLSESKYPFHSPRFIFDIAGSFNVPIGDGRGDISDFFKFKSYGLVHGVGFHTDIKYAANKSATLFPMFTGGFTHLQNDESDIAFIDSNSIRYGYPLSGNQQFNTVQGSCVLVIEEIHAGLGIEYIARSKNSVMPFAGFQMNYNFLWGYYEQTVSNIAGLNTAGTKTYFKIKPTQRIGAALDLGIHYRMTKELGFVCGTKYIISNLLGKKSERTSASTDNPDDLDAMNLLDKAATDLNSNLTSNRNLGYLQFYLGFSVFAGKRN